MLMCVEPLNCGYVQCTAGIVAGDLGCGPRARNEDAALMQMESKK